MSALNTAAAPHCHGSVGYCHGPLASGAPSAATLNSSIWRSVCRDPQLFLDGPRKLPLAEPSVRARAGFVIGWRRCRAALRQTSLLAPTCIALGRWSESYHPAASHAPSASLPHSLTRISLPPLGLASLPNVSSWAYHSESFSARKPPRLTVCTATTPPWVQDEVADFWRCVAARQPEPHEGLFRWLYAAAATHPVPGTVARTCSSR